MKANLTRGNSITENYNPYATVESSIHHAFLIVADAMDKYRKRRPIPNYIKGGIVPSGTAIVGERGPELIKLPSGTHVIPHRETRLMLNTDGSVWKWPTRVINGELIEVDLEGNPRMKL